MTALLHRLGDWLYDWRQTLRALADRQLTRELREPAKEPLADDEL